MEEILQEIKRRVIAIEPGRSLALWQPRSRGLYRQFGLGFDSHCSANFKL